MSDNGLYQELRLMVTRFQSFMRWNLLTNDSEEFIKEEIKKLEALAESLLPQESE